MILENLVSHFISTILIPDLNKYLLFLLLTVKKHGETGMLPLECPYLNKTALFTVVGQQVRFSFSRQKKPCFVIFFHVCLESSCKAFHAEKKTKVSGAESRVIAKIHRCSE